LNLATCIFHGRLVRLAALRPDDAEQFARWAESSDYLRLVDTDMARLLTAEELNEQQKAMRGPNAVDFAIRALGDDRLLGFAAIHSIEWKNGAGTLSIGIGDPQEWDKGYGTDAMRVLLRYAFDELNLHRLGLDVIGTNGRAIRVYEKVGFRHEGRRREAVLRDGRRADLVLMGILRQEWAATAQ